MAYTTIDDPSAYFHIQLYTGNSNTAQTITNNANAGDFKADWLWIKNRDDVEQHHLMDSNRGANKFMHSNSTDDERDGSYNGGHNDINAFGSNGFTITSSGSNDELNFGSRLYVTWQWKCNGGTTSSDSNGDQTSTVQANTTAGFSIATFESSSSAGQTVGHGLGSAPDMYIWKARDRADNWYIYHRSAGAGGYLRLNTNDAFTSNTNLWSNTNPSSTLIYYGGNSLSAGNEETIIYSFKSIQGYSKFGKYTGNNNADGTFVYTGFKPAWLILKNYDDSGSSANWYMFDNKRDTDNVVQNIIHPNENDAASDSAVCDFLSNGFKFRTADNAWNGNGDDYIYMAFAEHPFVSSDGVPVTAR